MMANSSALTMTVHSRAASNRPAIESRLAGGEKLVPLTHPGRNADVEPGRRRDRDQADAVTALRLVCSRPAADAWPETGRPWPLRRLNDVSGLVIGAS